MEKHLPAVLLAARGADVIVVDDCSTDDSVALLRKNYPQVKIIKTDRRRGFSSAVNLGVKIAKSDIIVLLNSDVEPEHDFLTHLLKHFFHKDVFAVGCMEKDNGVLRGRGIAHWEKGFYIHARGEVDKTDTPWVAGGSGAFRRDIWMKLGGMDELFNPFYWEDIDLSYRARKAGYKIRFEPKSIVSHYHDEGAIKTSFTDFEVKSLAYRNQFLFIWKNLTDTRIWLQHMIYTPLRLLGDPAMVIGYIKALIKLPQIVTSHIKLRSLWKKSDRSLDLS